MWLLRIFILSYSFAFLTQGVHGGRNWQNCKQFHRRFCNHLCGVSGSDYSGLCSKPGLCVCPPQVRPPDYCKEPSTFDYHEVVNCRNRQQICLNNAEGKNGTESGYYVCTDTTGKKSELDKAYFRYCVCFPK